MNLYYNKFFWPPILVTLTLLFFSAAYSEAQVGASVPPPPSGVSIPPSPSGVSIPPSPSGVSIPSSGGGAFSIKNPLKAKTISDFLKDLFRAAVKVGLPIVVLFIVYAGFLFVKARGNAEELTVAKRNFIWVIFGTTIFLGAWAIAEIIAATLRQLGV